LHRIRVITNARIFTIRTVYTATVDIVSVDRNAYLLLVLGLEEMLAVFALVRERERERERILKEFNSSKE